MKVFYHNDHDGRCAAAIVRWSIKDIKVDIDFREINYGMRFPWNEIKKEETVIMVDFSLQPYSDMVKLWKKSGGNMIWIDHHSIAIKEVNRLLQQNGIKQIPGFQSTEKSGCELTWDYYMSCDTPAGVLMIGDYDTWKFKFDLTREFQSGLQLQDTHPNSTIWDELFYDDSNADDCIDNICQAGTTIEEFKRMNFAEQIKNCSFDVELEGLKGKACNAWRTGSLLFESISNLYTNYDFVSTFYFKDNKWSISLYTERDDVDVGKIAHKFGGGGHKGAAGFEYKKLPFKIINKEKI